MLRISGLIAAWTLTSSLWGCSSMRFTAPDGMTVEDAYSGAADKPSYLRVGDAPSLTSREKMVPLMQPAQGFAVYVPQHADPENRMWIGDHWVYIELTRGGFFAEDVKELVPETRESVSDREVEDLKALVPGLKKITVPYKKRGAP